MSEFPSGRFQPMWGIPEQIPLRGTVNTAYTIIGRQGVADATARLAQAIFQRIESVTSDRSYLQALDALEPDRLGQAALNAVTSLEQFGESNPGLEQLEEFQKLLRDVQAGTSSRAVREVTGYVEGVVEGAVTELFAALNRAFESQPARVGEAISQCREALKEYQPRQANLRKVTEFRQILQKLRELPQFENMLIPETFSGVKTALLQQSRRTHEQAFTEVIRPKAWETLQNKLTMVEAFFKELEGKGARYARQVSAVELRLEEARQHARSEQTRLQSSVALELEGPDEDQVLSGMKTAANCSDLTQLVSLLEGEFQSRLREHARDRCPHIDAGQASFATLVLETADGEITTVLQRLVEDRLGTGHSLYQLVRATGIQSCVSHLWERAAPTCFFAGRDDQKFGLEPTELAILRLPQATSPADEEIRTELKQAFEGSCKVCHVDEGAEFDHEISLTRIFCGWVIGVETANRAMLERYVQAGEEGHLPHLIGLVPDALGGEMSPSYSRLLSQLRPWTDAETDDWLPVEAEPDGTTNNGDDNDPSV